MYETLDRAVYKCIIGIEVNKVTKEGQAIDNIPSTMIVHHQLSLYMQHPV